MSAQHHSSARPRVYGRQSLKPSYRILGGVEGERLCLLVRGLSHFPWPKPKVRAQM